ncbi:AC5 protein [Tomato leaf curl New Delhi virus]|uniref:AC5 n=1 Tax=Tomato leaf curl New Delhi virus-Severe TaxID=223351 RepID=Q88536_9GEMI|nr:AC5 protein [Tomato leaf curl New Delhi virus]AAA92808.1 AC5 [Tomato leaf curl New Delhi virus-Severe]
MHVLHRCCARFIVKHIKHFPEILGRSCRTTVTNQKKHDTVSMVFCLDVFIHPYLSQHIDRFHTESLPYAMCESSSSGNITNTHDFANMRDIVPRFKGLHFTRAFTAPWHVGTSIHSVHSGFSVHRPVGPGLCFGDAGNGDNCTSSIGAVEVETSAYLRCGR